MMDIRKLLKRHREEVIDQPYEYYSTAAGDIIVAGRAMENRIAELEAWVEALKAEKDWAQTIEKTFEGLEREARHFQNKCAELENYIFWHRANDASSLPHNLQNAMILDKHGNKFLGEFYDGDFWADDEDIGIFNSDIIIAYAEIPPLD